jgi:hypothetical protein
MPRIWTILATILIVAVAGPPHAYSSSVSASAQRPVRIQAFSVDAYVLPDRVYDGQVAMLVAVTRYSAVCKAVVAYPLGRSTIHLVEHAKTVPNTGLGLDSGVQVGRVSWRFRVDPRATSGSGAATVQCSLRGKTRSATTGFTFGRPCSSAKCCCLRDASGRVPAHTRGAAYGRAATRGVPYRLVGVERSD